MRMRTKKNGERITQQKRIGINNPRRECIGVEGAQPIQ